MKNLVVLFTYGLSLKTWEESGLIARELQIYQKLAEQKKLKIHLLTYGDETDLKISSRYPELNVIPAYHWIPKSKNSLLRIIKSFYLFYSLRGVLPKKYTVKTNQMFGSWAAFLPAICGQPLTTRCGYELLWTHLRESKGLANKWLKAVFYYFLEGTAYTLSSNIILTTDHAATFITRIFPWLNKNKITIIPNYIDTEAFRPTNSSTTDKTILFVGRLNRIKNLEALLSALSGTQWSLDIVGKGELEGELKTKVEKEQLPVRFLGIFPNDQLPQIYGRYRFFLLPSLFENNPKTLMEAMSCGLVCCGTAVPGIKPLISDSMAGLLAPNTDSTSLRKLLLEMAKLSENQIKKMQDSARKYATNSFSLDFAVEKEFSIHQENLNHL